MSRLQSSYRRLAAVMVLVAAACALAWLFVVRPHRVRAAEYREALVQKRKALRLRGWSMDREALERLLAERTRILDGAGAGEPGLKLRAEQVRQHATAMFRRRIQEEFQTPEAFVRNASNIDFREAFSALQRRLAADGIWVAPEVLNLSEDSSIPYTYQLLLQVWVLERVADLLQEHRLTVLTDAAVRVRSGSGEQPAARIVLQPIVAYYLEPGSPLPYLLGIPVRLRLRGDLAQVRRFVGALTAEGNFLPPVQVEVYADDPRGLGRRVDGAEPAGAVVVDITCCGFFAFPGGDAPPPPPRPAVPVPVATDAPEGG